MAYCDAQVVCALGVDGDARAAPLKLFVDELLGLCSELTCLAVCRLPVKLRWHVVVAHP